MDVLVNTGLNHTNTHKHTQTHTNKHTQTHTNTHVSLFLN